jgi:serine/threonine-protein kinase
MLGRGGMGEVYVAYDEGLHRNVALKILVEGEARSRQRMLREARAVAAVDHPNVVQVFDVHEVDGVPFVAMELVEGKTLRERMREPGLTLDVRIDWLVAIAEGLHAAHARGVIHRDVKPENVLVRSDGVVKVVDFGIARRKAPVPVPSLAFEETVESVATEDNPVQGTLAYMAPEQLRGEPLDGRADQWSWGVVAYELLAGELPWDTARGGIGVVSQILSSEPRALRDRNGEVPPLVADAVMRALAKGPEARWPDLGELLAAVASPEGAPKRPVLRARSITIAAMLVGIVLGGALVLAPHSMASKTTRTATTTDAAADVSRGPPDFGSQMSPNPEAFAAYARAVQAVHDAASASSVDEGFAKARRLDPDFAAAYLRGALATDDPLDGDWREIFAGAQLRRDRLGAHDRALLEAAEPWFRVPADPAEVRRRFAELARLEDADYDLQRCVFLRRLGDGAGAREACRDAERLDPTLAAAYYGEGDALGMLGSREAEEKAYRACLERSPEGAKCLLALALLFAAEGHCREYAETARRLFVITPNDTNAMVIRARAIYAEASREGASMEAFAEADRFHTERDDPKFRDENRLQGEAAIAVAEGRLADAAALWDRYSKLFPDEVYAGAGLHAELEILMEIGRDDDAIRLSRRWLAQRAAWVPSVLEDTRIFAFGGLYLEGAMTRPVFLQERRRWLDAEAARHATAEPWYRWTDAFGNTIRGKEDAEDALAAMSSFAPIPAAGQDVDVDVAVGVALLRAGHAVDAVPRLRAAAESCPRATHPMPQLLALAWYGDALAATGATSEACAAYEALLRHWGRAPGSRSAARAREAIERLRCGD